MEAKAFVSFFNHKTEVEGKVVEFSSAVFDVWDNGTERHLCAFGPFEDFAKLTLIKREDKVHGKSCVRTRWPVMIYYVHTDDPEIVEVVHFRELPVSIVCADESDMILKSNDDGIPLSCTLEFRKAGMSIVDEKAPALHPFRIYGNNVDYSSNSYVRTYQYVSFGGKDGKWALLDIPSKLWDAIIGALADQPCKLTMDGVTLLISKADAYIIAANKIHVSYDIDFLRCTDENTLRKCLLPFCEIVHGLSMEQTNVGDDEYDDGIDDYYDDEPQPSLSDFYDDVDDLELNTRGDGFD